MGNLLCRTFSAGRALSPGHAWCLRSFWLCVALLRWRRSSFLPAIPETLSAPSDCHGLGFFCLRCRRPLRCRRVFRWPLPRCRSSCCAVLHRLACRTCGFLSARLLLGVAAWEITCTLLSMCLALAAALFAAAVFPRFAPTLRRRCAVLPRVACCFAAALACCLLSRCRRLLPRRVRVCSGWGSCKAQADAEEAGAEKNKRRCRKKVWELSYRDCCRGRCDG